MNYPNPAMAARILDAYLQGVPGAKDVDSHAVSAPVGAETSGADIREIVRRTILAQGAVCTEELLSTARSGRFKPQFSAGNYL